MLRVALLVVSAVLLLPVVLIVGTNLALHRGAWRLARALGRAVRRLLGPTHGGGLAFLAEVLALRETGHLAEAAALARHCLADESASTSSRNAAIDVLISAGQYRVTLGAEPPSERPASPADALARTLVQLNLAEAEYNLGLWDAAEERLRRVEGEGEAARFALTRAWLQQQKAWIAADRGRGPEAVALCAAMKPSAVPGLYRSEYHFTRAAALLAAGRLDEAEAEVARGQRVARRLSSRRNALFLRARVAEARGRWAQVEQSCREAANHPFRGQGGGGLLLWARALRALGRDEEAAEALRLVVERDPESEAAGQATAMLKSFHDESSLPGSGP